MPFDKSKYDQEYNKAHIRRKFIPFNDTNPDDLAMLEWMAQQGNVTQYIKRLIRADMNKKPLPYLITEIVDINNGSEGHRFEKYCPTCNVCFGLFYPPKYCPNCGQFIDIEHGKRINTKTVDNRTKKT